MWQTDVQRQRGKGLGSEGRNSSKVHRKKKAGAASCFKKQEMDKKKGTDAKNIRGRGKRSFFPARKAITPK